MTVTVAALVSCGTQKKIADGNVTDKPSVTTEIDNSNWHRWQKSANPFDQTFF